MHSQLFGWLGDSVAQGRRRIDFEGVWYDGRDMNRRSFFQTCISAAGAMTLRDRADAAGLPKTKITRIRYYKTPTDAAGRPNNRQPLFNQSTNVGWSKPMPDCWA